MATLVFSAARSMLNTPGAVCATVSTSIHVTHRLVKRSVHSTVNKSKALVCKSVEKTNAAAQLTFRIATRPFLWPLELSLDLSRRISIQVLHTVREILEALDAYAVALEVHLSQQKCGRKQENGEDDKIELACRDCLRKKLDFEMVKDQACRAKKRNSVQTRKLTLANRQLRREARRAENKCDALRAEISELKEMYSEKLEELETERDILEHNSQGFLDFIGSAQELAQECQVDVQTLLNDLYELSDATSLDTLPLSLDLDAELALYGTEEPLEICDSGYYDDVISFSSDSLQLCHVRSNYGSEDLTAEPSLMTSHDSDNDAVGTRNDSEDELDFSWTDYMY